MEEQDLLPPDGVAFPPDRHQQQPLILDDSHTINKKNDTKAGSTPMYRNNKLDIGNGSGSSSSSSGSGIVKLNVGGHFYQTTVQTLTGNNNSNNSNSNSNNNDTNNNNFFVPLLNGTIPTTRDEEGNIFIDRYVPNYNYKIEYNNILENISLCTTLISV